MSGEEEGLFSPYGQSPYGTMEIEQEADQEEPEVLTATEQQEFIPTLPTEVLWDIVGRLGPTGVSRVRGASRAFQDIGTAILEPIKARTHSTVCPNSAICDGSLLCAVASDDVQAVEDILFVERTRPGNKTVDNVEIALMGGPCRVIKWEYNINNARSVRARANALTLDAFAVETSAPNVLTFLMPSIMRRGASAWASLLSEAIKSMGHCIWIAHFTDTAPLLQGSLERTPTITATDWRALLRAASAISWRGQRVTEPETQRRWPIDAMLDDAIARNSVEWTTILYDSPAMARILTAPTIQFQQAAASIGPKHTHFLFTFAKSILKISGLFGNWISATYGYLLTGNAERVERILDSLPSAYVKLFHDMAPFYAMSVTNAEQHSAFREAVITLQDTFYQDLLAITGWLDLLNVLLDAGLRPRQNAGKGRATSVIQNQRALTRDVYLHPMSAAAQVANPLDRWFGQWVEGLVALRILDDIEQVYRQRGLIND